MKKTDSKQFFVNFLLAYLIIYYNTESIYPYPGGGMVNLHELGEIQFLTLKKGSQGPFFFF